MMDKSMEKTVDRCVEHIAIARRTTEIMGGSADDFDKQLNEMCEKWYEKFAEMNATELAVWMVKSIVDEVKEGVEYDG